MLVLRLYVMVENIIPLKHARNLLVPWALLLITLQLQPGLLGRVPQLAKQVVLPDRRVQIPEETQQIKWCRVDPRCSLGWDDFS